MQGRLRSSISLAVALALGSTAVASSALAKDPPGRARHYVLPYGMAGCGLYTYVLKDKDRGAQLAIWALRGLLVPDFQTSAISSGTSNCTRKQRAETEDEESARLQEQQVFIATNLNSLSKEAAQGDGEHLGALAEVFGCPEPAFAQLSQQHYADIFNSLDPDTVRQNYLRTVRGDAALAETCERTS